MWNKCTLDFYFIYGFMRGLVYVDFFLFYGVFIVEFSTALPCLCNSLFGFWILPLLWDHKKRPVEWAL